MKNIRKKLLIIIYIAICFSILFCTPIWAQTDTNPIPSQQNPFSSLIQIFSLFFKTPDVPIDYSNPFFPNNSTASPGASLSLPSNISPGSFTPNLLPNPLQPIAPEALSFIKTVQSCLSNYSIYQSASTQTGVPWEILVAIHYNEGSCAQNQSLVSGREIGKNEPDIVRGGGCSSGRSGPGIPIPLPSGGCGFYTLLDSAIYAGNHIKGKIGKVPSNFQDLSKAFSRYSGGGNSNCGSTPYQYCPELFEGEDDAYVMNMFDNKHEKMYLVYCADLTKCNPARFHMRPGVATIIRLLTNQL